MFRVPKPRDSGTFDFSDTLRSLQGLVISFPYINVPNNLVSCPYYLEYLQDYEVSLNRFIYSDSSLFAKPKESLYILYIFL